MMEHDEALAQSLHTILDGKREREITYREMVQLILEHVRSGLSEILIGAVDTGNVDILSEIANAVLFFRDRRGKNFYPVDRERCLLLMAKSRLKLYDQKWTIREVAGFLAGRKVEASADGFSALRRKCRELGFPLAESRKRKKK